MVPLRHPMAGPNSQTYNMLCSWLSKCVRTHEACHPSKEYPMANLTLGCESVPLPTRLVDVGSPSGDIHPFLVKTSGRRGAYLTLSHCWGTGRKVKTLKENIGHFMQQFPENELSPTFKDAINLTRQLGFQYIWIDSLCIIQDDEEDWFRESEKMGAIFESSSCTIAAVHALDEKSMDRGLFFPRDDALAVEVCCPFERIPLRKLSENFRNENGRTCVWKYIWLKKDKKESNIDVIKRHSTVILRPRIISLWYKIRQTEWYNRGWVFQERMLSRRIIYYCRDQIHWQCFCEDGSEQSSNTTPPARRAWFSSSDSATETARLFGHELASDYSTCQLTFRKDNLIAIKGVCNKFSAHYGQRFHAGILDDETGQSLLWHASQSSMPLYPDFHAPSWAWICRAGKPSYFIPPILGEITKSLIKHLCFQMKSNCPFNNPRGLCKGTCISGVVSFIAPVGELFRDGKLFDIKIEGYDLPLDSASDDVLIWILGSGVHSNGIGPPQIDARTGESIHLPRQLYLPRHTELLMESHGCHIIGYFIPDEERSNDERIPVICAGVLLSQHAGPLKQRPFSGLVKGYKYELETCIDFIGLEPLANDTTRYRRVGRGRILCNSWLAQCTEKTIDIT